MDSKGSVNIREPQLRTRLHNMQLNREQGLQFRAFVPFLVANLEDADAGVRETAKSVVVELFR